MSSFAPHHQVAEVIARDGRLRLRLGFDDGDGVLGSRDALSGFVLERGSFVAHNEGTPLTDDSGSALIVAAAGSALADVHRLAARAGVRIGFPSALLSEASALASQPVAASSALRDLRKLPFVTIDYEHSRDLDQAVYIERCGADYDVYYALADAAHYIDPASGLFAEALARGTSFYMPGLTVPMLPRSLSEGTVSLNPALDRRAFVFRIRIDDSGDVRDYELFAGLIHSRAKLTYDGVQALADEPRDSPLAQRDFAESLGLLREVGEARIAEATSRDVVRYDRVSAALSLGDRLAPTLHVKRETRNQAQKWNEQISLVTNIVGAEYLREHTDQESGLAGLFRVHPRPEGADLDSFARSVNDLIESLGLDESWRWKRESESLAQYIDRLPDEGQGVRLACALQRQAMLMGRPSTFSTEPAPHFGVGAAAYSRFSSPMREIVGIVTMHIALAQRAENSLSARGLTDELVEKAVAAGNRAGKLQKKLTRECNKLAIDQLLSAELKQPVSQRPTRTATVLGVTENKIYLQLDDPPIELKLYVPDQERLLGHSFVLRSRFELASADLEKPHSVRVGEAVNLRVDGYAEGRERWVLRLLDDH